MLSTDCSVGLFTSGAVRLSPLESGAVALRSGSGFGGAVRSRVLAVFAGVSASMTTLSSGVRGLFTGGSEQNFVARGDTGGLHLAFSAAIFGEYLRLGGIGVPDFWGLVCSGVLAVLFTVSSSCGASLALCSTEGAMFALSAEAGRTGVGLDSGVGAGAGTGAGEGSLAGVERLQVRVVVSLEGLS